MRRTRPLSRRRFAVLAGSLCALALALALPARPIGAQHALADAGCTDPACASHAASEAEPPATASGVGLLFDTSSFPPRWQCGTWSAVHGWTHIASDLLIWLAYLAIPVILVLFARKRRDLPFPGLFLLFGAFILLCGTTHLLESLLFWWPAYRFLGLVKILTAAVSIATAIVCIPIVPRALALRGPGELEDEVRTRTRELEELQERLREERDRAESGNRAKSRFLANMSHEIRTPLTAILGFSEVLEEELAGRAEAERVSTIRRNGEHLLAVLDDILDSSKIEAGRLSFECTPFSPLAAIESAVELLRVPAARKGIAIEIAAEEGLPPTALGDPKRFRQVILNLLGNAVKFTDAGSVRVEVRAESAADAIAWTIEVTDTGRGMTAEEAARVFEAFAQGDESTSRRYGGTGLGLTISRRLAERMGGALEIARTAPGEDSTFRWRAPLRVPSVARRSRSRSGDGPGASEAAPAGALAGLRILLAEDGADIRALVSHFLARAGATVEVVEDGLAAVERLRAARGDAAFDAVLLDVQMPVLDGLSACRAAREEGYEGPIIALTANAFPDDVRRSLEAGCDAHESKPIRRESLIATILAATRETHAS